jgi:NADPH:quinone reductase
MIHRVANVQSRHTALVTGAAGGVGTAALQLLRLAGLKTYGAASDSKHDTLRSLGATPIDHRKGALDQLVRALEPEGVDYVFDAVGGANVGLSIGAVRPGGIVVGFGFMGAPGLLSKLAMFSNLFIGAAPWSTRQFLRHQCALPEEPQTFSRGFAENLCAPQR